MTQDNATLRLLLNDRRMTDRERAAIVRHLTRTEQDPKRNAASFDAAQQKERKR